MLDMADLLDFMTEIMDTTWYLQKTCQLGGKLRLPDGTSNGKVDLF